jgi:hypothetical protein
MALVEWLLKLYHRDNPIYKPLFDETMPITQRFHKINLNKQVANQDKIAQLKSKHGPDYIHLHPISKYVLYKDIWSRKVKESIIGRAFLAFRCRWWSFRLWNSKRIQAKYYISPTKIRRSSYVPVVLVAALVGSYFADRNSIMSSPLILQFSFLPRVHWMSSYLVDTAMLKEKDEDFKKDNLAQGMERVLSEGIQLGKLDSLNWLMLGTYFSVRRDEEFAYLAFHMAHLVEHQKVGGNSLQPLDLEDASKLFRK